MQLSSAALLLGVTVVVQTPMTPSELDELAEACSRALTDSTCRVTSGDSGGGPKDGEILAHVSSSTKDRFEISIDGGDERRTTTLDFRPEDSEAERARTIGLAIGLIGLESKRAGENQTRPDEREKSDPTGAPVKKDAPVRAANDSGRASSEPRTHSASRSGPYVGAALGVGHDPGGSAALLSGELSSGLRLGRTFVGIKASAVHFPFPRHTFVAWALAPELRVTRDFSADEFHQMPFLAAGVEYLWFQNRAPAPTGIDGRMSPVFSLGVEWGLVLPSGLALFLAPQADLIASPTTLVVGDERTLTLSPLRFGVHLGVSYAGRRSRDARP